MKVDFAMWRKALNVIPEVLNDPFGWGWNLLNISSPTRSVDVSGFSPILQVILLLVGVVWSTQVTNKLSKAAGEKRHEQNEGRVVGVMSLATQIKKAAQCGLFYFCAKRCETISELRTAKQLPSSS